MSRHKSASITTRDAIIKMVARKRMKAGDQLPSEAELTEMFDISRPTLREALRLLEQDGLIRTQHGRGRFISAAASLQVERPITTYESITTMLRELGYKPDTEILSLGEQAADVEVAAELRCGRGAPVLAIERLRRQQGEVLVYSLEIVPRQAFTDLPDKADMVGSLNELLAHSAHRPRMSVASISACTLPKSIPIVARGKYKGPWLLITETCFTEEGTPVIFSRIYHRGDLFSFNFSRR